MKGHHVPPRGFNNFIYRALSQPGNHVKKNFFCFEKFHLGNCQLFYDTKATFSILPTSVSPSFFFFCPLFHILTYYISRLDDQKEQVKNCRSKYYRSVPNKCLKTLQREREKNATESEFDYFILQESELGYFILLMPREVKSTSWKSRLWHYKTYVVHSFQGHQCHFNADLQDVPPTCVFLFNRVFFDPRRYVNLSHKLTQLSLRCTWQKSSRSRESGKVALWGCTNDLCNFTVMPHLLAIGISMFLLSLHCWLGRQKQLRSGILE